MTATTLAVQIHPELVERLLNDHCLIREDAPLRELLSQLPTLHRKCESPNCTRPRTRLVRLYHGRFAWMNTGFSYVRIGSTLTLVDIWRDGEFASRRRRKRIDCVIRATW